MMDEVPEEVAVVRAAVPAASASAGIGLDEAAVQRGEVIPHLDAHVVEEHVVDRERPVLEVHGEEREVVQAEQPVFRSGG